MTLITDLKDGRVNMFRDYAKSAAGFVGHEKVLFLSLVAALEQLAEFKKLATEEETPDETGDQGTG